MRKNSALGPDGIPVDFYKCFWEQVNGPELETYKKFHRGELNLSRLNYGPISLIPKLKETNNIK
jgi:hypothetical protein